MISLANTYHDSRASLLSPLGRHTLVINGVYFIVTENVIGKPARFYEGLTYPIRDHFYSSQFRSVSSIAQLESPNR